jgi:hypothetical protein
MDDALCGITLDTGIVPPAVELGVGGVVCR